MSARLRLRWLIIAGFCVSTAGAALVLYLRIPGVVRGRLEGRVPAADVEATVDAVRLNTLLAAALGLVLAWILASWLTGTLAAALARLRAELLRLGREPTASAPAPQGFRELEPVAAAATRVAVELAQRAQHAARERDDLALLLDSVTDGILQLGAGGRIVRVNPAARRLLGLPADAEGKPIGSLVRHVELREMLTEALAGGASEPTEISLDSRRVLVIARGIPAAYEGAATTEAQRGAVAVFVDLTEVRRLETVRRDFVANVSHELKTPLTSICGYAETLLADDVPAETQRNFLETIARNAARLQRIVDDLLDLSRIESGGWRPMLVPLDAAAAAYDAWAPFVERASTQSVRFDVAADGVRVLADADALRQVFSNLFDNALRYTPAGGRIEVRAVPAPPADQDAPLVLASDAAAPHQAGESARVAIEVRDTGAGIPSDALPRIFERFYRVDPARSRAEGGTGLGLSIVKHLVERMGGDVTAESALGKGTTIRFTLPAAPVPAPAGGADGDAAATTPAAAAGNPTPTGGG
ncbi:MAG: ATP-binding protein [bacterium]|jgi:two-component system phosphate regulon sensor histidine kinase PhoR|nr:MAG: PAS domain-containing sensor histidine kinase [bacterium]